MQWCNFEQPFALCRVAVTTNLYIHTDEVISACMVCGITSWLGIAYKGHPANA